MTIELLDDRLRIALAIAAVVLIAGAFLVGRRAIARVPRAAASLGLIVAVGCIGVLAAEALVAVTVRLAAPRAADFNEFRWVFMAPWGRVGLWLGTIAVAAIAGLGWWSTRNLGPWRRAAIVGLRTGAAALALVVFLQPAIELRQVAREPNRVAFLIDDSRSMTLKESPDGPTRQARVKALMKNSAETLATWSQDHQLDFYTFSDVVAAIGQGAIGTTKSDGDATLIRKALESVRARYDGRDLAGVVLISDGAATDAFDEAGEGTARDFLRSLETRVHTVWAARPGLRDLAVARVLADEFAFVRTVVRLEAVLRNTGYGPKRVQVTLSSDGQALRQKWVDLPAEGEANVTFEVTPPRVGRYVYEISIPVEEDEAVRANNARSFVVRVIRDKIRVLQVAGAPSWDVRALRELFEQNPNVDLISFFILRTQDDIQMNVSNDELSLIPFPTRELFEEQLPSFDLIVLQNFEYLPYGLGDYLENIRAYVEGGGGLAMLGGDLSFSSGGYEGTPIAAALPVELIDPWTSATLLDTQRFRAALTDAGKTHPVTALRYVTADNVAAWKSLPELEGVNLLAAAKPDATVLAVHPTLKTRDGKAMPVVVTGEYGEGRSLAITTDTVWRWGFVAAARPGDDGRHYDKFWENAIRWLIQDPDLRNLHVDSDAVEYTPGATVRLAIRLLGRDYQPLPKGKVHLTITRGADPGTAGTVDETNIVVGEDGAGSHEMTAPQPGVYRVRGTAEVAGKKVEANDIFLVREGGTELDHPAGSEETLETIASSTGGRHLGAAERIPDDLALDPPRIVRVDRRADVELWSRPGLLVLALLFLGLEWLLRQRSGYL
jgi:uncharacterized membrane protein